MDAAMPATLITYCDEVRWWILVAPSTVGPTQERDPSMTLQYSRIPLFLTDFLGSSQ